MLLCNWGSAFQRLSRGFTRRRFEAIGQREDVIACRERSGQIAFRTRGKTGQQRKEELRRVSDGNQLVGRIESVQIGGLVAEVRVFNRW
jgi:hypothetical protein